jgi:hypothetical protein
MPITSSTPGSVSTTVGRQSTSSAGRRRFLLTDHRYLCRRPRHVLWIIYPSAPTIWYLGSGSQKMAISEVIGHRESRRKNQQSRVERPITDWSVSWSCLGIVKDFIPEAECTGDLPEVVLRERERGGRIRTGMPSQGPICRIKAVSLDLCCPSSRSLYPILSFRG